MPFADARRSGGGRSSTSVVHALPMFCDPDGFHDNIVRGARVKFNDSSRLKLRRRAYIQWEPGHPSKILIVKKTKNAATSRQLKVIGDWLVEQGLQVFVERSVHMSEFPEFGVFEAPVLDDPEGELESCSDEALGGASTSSAYACGVPLSWHSSSPQNTGPAAPIGMGLVTNGDDGGDWEGDHASSIGDSSSSSSSDSTNGNGSSSSNGSNARPATQRKVRGTDVDLCITLGGDGTVLHMASLFERDEPLPPVISFAMGSLGFLTPFDVSEFKMRLSRVLSAVQGSASGPLFCTLRTRKRCEVHHGGKLQCVHNVLNEMVLDRGASPSVSVMELFIDGNHVTTVEADGLIIASPSGSTAYSLSAGGPIIAPSVPCTILTPIAPLSLSFRPLVVPESSSILIHLPETMRSHARASFDGKRPMRVRRDSVITVSTSLCPLPVINMGAMDSDWYDGVNKKLKWNQAMRQPPKINVSNSNLQSSVDMEWYPEEPQMGYSE